MSWCEWITLLLLIQMLLQTLQYTTIQLTLEFDGLHLDFSFYFCWSKNPLTLKEFLIRHIFQCSAHVVHRLVTRSWIVKSSRWQGTNWTSHLTQVGKEKGLENHLQSIIASGKLFSMHHLLKTWWSCLIGFLYICTYHVSFVLLLYILSFPYLAKQKIQSKMDIKVD